MLFHKSIVIMQPIFTRHKSLKSRVSVKAGDSKLIDFFETDLRLNVLQYRLYEGGWVSAWVDTRSSTLRILPRRVIAQGCCMNSSSIFVYTLELQTPQDDHNKNLLD